MCLSINPDNKPQTAITDIVCYKFLKIEKNSKNEILYCTPYIKDKVIIGNTYKSKLKHERYARTDIEIGLHSFLTQVVASHYASIIYVADYDWYGHAKIAIAKCIIPKGAKYYTGYFNGYDSYASNELTYLEIVEDLTLA